MNTWIRVLAVSWFLTGVFPGVSGGVIEFGDRPPTQVFDPAGSLGAPMTAEISEPLVSIYQNEGVDVVVVVLDNLLKGAASQALQNINLALGLDELAGLK